MILYKDKRIQVETFVNGYKDKMFSIHFLTDPDSSDDYRGWKVSKAAKVAKRLRKIAKKLETL